MAEILGMDLTDDRLITLASTMVDNHNYIDALKILNKNGALNGDSADTLALYAEIFDDLGLYEKCVNGWFKFLDFADASDLSDCYEGLAVSFMNLGNEHSSAYYYNQLLAETEELDSFSREELLKEFMSDEDNPLKFVYPPALADCSEIISKGINFMKSGEYDQAVEQFENVEDGNPKYLSARNYIAMCKIISDRVDEAEEECLNILKKHPEDVQALTTLSAVKTERGESEKAVELARKLLELNVTETDDIYKIATVCCENKLHKEAYTLFCKLSEDLAYDLNVLYFKAVSAFNSGLYEESFQNFDTLCTIYPEAVTARYFFNRAREMKESGEIEELSYFYRLPMEMREATLKLLSAFIRLSKTSAQKLSKELDLSSAVKWCFDEIDPVSGEEIQRVAAHVAVKAGMDEFIRDLLLNAFVGDQLKIEILSHLAERNCFDCFGVVMCNIFKHVSTQTLAIGRLKHKAFVNAYAELVAHFAVLDDENGYAFAEAAEDLYAKFEEQGRLNEVKSHSLLTACIFVLSGVHVAGIEGDKVYSFFGVTKEQILEFIGEE